MHLGAGKGARRRRAGFTLVEVIVVLVILAILAAIAIPALTGYIDKAQDKQWIAEARNAMVAMRATISEAYAEGTFGASLPESGNDSDYLNTGNITATFNNFKFFDAGVVANYDSSPTIPASRDNAFYYRKAAGLMGITYTKNAPGMWLFYLLSPKDEPSHHYDIFSAPAWQYAIYPEGNISGKPMTLVTYGLGGDGFDPDSIKTLTEYGVARNNNAVCDPTAGYKVFHVTV